MRTKENLLGKCGVFCGACRLYDLKNCKGCSGEEHGCQYIKCVNAKALISCGQCQEFPCDKHYGPKAVYAELYLNWKKRELNQT